MGSSLLTLSAPDDGYSRNASWEVVFWLWAHLMMVIAETRYGK